MKNINIYLIILTSLFFSCQKEIEFDEKLIAPKIVINGFIETDSLIDVKITTSKAIAGIEQPYTWLDDATVTLFVDDVEVEELTYYKIEYTESEEGGYYYYGSNSSRPSGGYRSQQTVGEIGKTYKLVVSHPNYETTTAENYIPQKVEIISFESEEKLEPDEYNDYENNVLNVKLKFKDNANEENYYRLSVRVLNGEWDLNWNEKEDTIGFIRVSEYYPQYLIQDDPVLNPSEEGANDFLSTAPSNQYSVFTDEFIDGKEHELDFSFILNYNGWMYEEEQLGEEHEGEFYQYQISLQTITRETYLYLVSSNANQWYSEDFFSEPVQVFSNVDNGAGIFGGFSSSTFNINKGEYPIDGIEYQFNNYSNYYYY